VSAQARRALLLRSMVGEFERRVNEFLGYADAHPAADFAELEAEARRLSRDVFAPALAAAVQERRAAAEAAPRCACGGAPADKGEQPRRQETYVGPITWRRRYYHCAACGRGAYPLDEALGIAPGAFSEGLHGGIARLGAALPFAPAAEAFTALTGVPVSGREVGRLTEARGAALEAHQAAGRARLLAGEPPPAAPGEPPGGPGVWAAALDAAKVRFADGWHEAKAGVIAWARAPADGEPGARAVGQSYVVEVGPLEGAGARLYAEARRRGIDPAEELVVCLGDGAAGIWHQFARHFPRRVEVLDWYHAVEHLWAAGNGVFGEGTPAAAWVGDRKAELWAGKVAAVLAALGEAAAHPRGAAAAAEIGYFETNAERMRYDQYRAQGYPIGSGTVESACKRVIGARAKQAGMCWGQPGAQGVLSLRAELLSGRWEQTWPATRPRPKVA